MDPVDRLSLGQIPFLMGRYDDAKGSLDPCRNAGSPEARLRCLTGIVIVDQKPIRPLLNGESDALLFAPTQPLRHG